MHVPCLHGHYWKENRNSITLDEIGLYIILKLTFVLSVALCSASQLTSCIAEESGVFAKCCHDLAGMDSRDAKIRLISGRQKFSFSLDIHTRISRSNEFPALQAAIVVSFMTGGESPCTCICLGPRRALELEKADHSTNNLRS